MLHVSGGKNESAEEPVDRRVRCDCCLASSFSADADDYVIGSSAGLTGYTAILDGAWVDGVKLAIKQINEKGGLLGNQIKLVVEDNRAEPQEAVTPTARCCRLTARRSS